MAQALCRLCLSKDELKPIFVDSEQSERYTIVLNLTTGLKIRPNDGLPQQICNVCTDSVNNSLKLRDQSQASEIKLLELGYQRIEAKITTTEDNNVEYDNKQIVLEDISADCFDFHGFKIEVELDRISQDGDGGETPSADLEKPLPKKKNTRKERREQYLSLVDGEFDPKGPVKCKICKTTVSKWTCFINHAKKHLGFKFVCEFCGKSFISSNQLKRHCRSFHGMERDLKCKHCNYLALDKPQLLVHERREHTGERPYVCDVCAAAYFSRKCLLQHLECHRTEASVQLTSCTGININHEENTFKQYYFEASDDENTDSPYPLKRSRSESLDEFFNEPQKKKPKVCSSTVGRAIKDGMSYISTNHEDGATASHLIKVEIFDLKKIANIKPSDQWKHADTRVKYYVNSTNQKATHHKQTRQLIYNITKEISNIPNCKKYTYKYNV